MQYHGSSDEIITYRHPYVPQDVQLLKAALDEAGPMWQLQLLDALGLLNKVDFSEMYCRGCHIHSHQLKWMYDGLVKLGLLKPETYMAEKRLVIVNLRGEITIDRESLAARDLEALKEMGVDAPKYTFFCFPIHGVREEKEEDQSGAHAMFVTLKSLGMRRWVVGFFDPNGCHNRQKTYKYKFVLDVIRTMTEPGGIFYHPTCEYLLNFNTTGIQTIAKMEPEGEEIDIGGSCSIWSTIFMLFSILLGGMLNTKLLEISLVEIFRELPVGSAAASLATNYPATLTSLSIILSRNFARLAHEVGGLECPKDPTLDYKLCIFRESSLCSPKMDG